MASERVSITFSAYLDGGVADGTPLWRPRCDESGPAREARTGKAGAAGGDDADNGSEPRDRPIEPRHHTAELPDRPIETHPRARPGPSGS